MLYNLQNLATDRTTWGTASGSKGGAAVVVVEEGEATGGQGGST